MDKKYQVFISSTFADLQEARQKVMDTILQLHQIPAGMEMFPASDDDQMTHIKSEIDRSDYYILILGHRYGSMSSEGISFTEMEYNYAIEQGIPVLAFIIDKNVPVRPADLDATADAKKKLDKFRAKAQRNKLCKFWTSPDDLATKVSTSLSHSFTVNPRIGWIRGNQATSPQVAEELASLTRENRNLKEKLEGLRVTRQPSILVGINNSQEINLEYMRVSPNFLEEPEILIKENVPNEYLKYIQEKDFEDYNSWVPEGIKQIKEYNRELYLFEEISSTGLDFQISLTNKGSIKANNIYVDIKFPSSVTVLEGKKGDFTQPAIPSIKINPVKSAERRFNKEYIPLKDSDFFLALNGFSGYNFRRIPDFAAGNSLSPNIGPPRKCYAHLDDDEITVVCDSLIHTRLRTIIDPFILIPKEPGEFEIKLSVICEEYSKPEEFIIPLSIIE
ncbi:DUF4062 domain-containing protein [Bacillus mesophilum]|uniref:DUF4062 domain-containing protein n=1 Tax=Bacillus mesophilum TaxID=1071718 RepID=A0A7V7USV2_9BACI|nr:DUF4062 domain-containing protein [Bacillus mesophilum]KAB2329483.1 DUF4062 domain-containing protein [Bacillus mesophilum]